MEDGRKVTGLSLEVYCDLGTLNDPSSAMWTCHAVDEMQCNELRNAWLVWVGFTGNARLRWASTPVLDSETRLNWVERYERWRRANGEAPGYHEDEKQFEITEQNFRMGMVSIR